MDSPDAEYQHFSCESCGVRLKAKASKAGQQLPCPKCGKGLVIPRAPADIYGIRAEEESLRPMLSPHEHSGPVRPVAGNNAGNNADNNVEGSGDGEDNGAEGDGKRGGRLRQEPSFRPELPKWPLVRGVLSFLLEPGAIVYWSVFSLMGTLLSSLLLGAFVLGQIPVAWIGSSFLLSLSAVLYLSFVLINAIYCITILQESAAGNRVVEEWPGIMLLDHLGEAFVFINSVLVAVMVAWFITLPLAGLELFRALCGAGCLVVLFPVVLLSMLEAGSCLMPVSTAVFQTIRRSWRTWLVFYVESFVFVFGLLAYLALLDALLLLLVDYGQVKITLPLVLIAVAMGVGPAMLLEMVYFRLIGRLAWVCDEDSRRELAAAEAAEKEAEEEQRGAGEADLRSSPVDDF